MPTIAVVIPNYNGGAHLEACLRSLAAQARPPQAILVVDNASSDNSLDRVRRVAPGAQIMPQSRNAGFAAAANLGARAAGADWVAIVNNDAELSPGWMDACLDAIRRYPQADFFACRILDFRDRNRLYGAGDCFLRAGIGYRRGEGLPAGPGFMEDAEVFSACGCAALYRRDIFLEAGGFDEGFFAYLEDVDLGLRLRAAGRRGMYVASAEVFHIGGATSGGEYSSLSVRLRTRNSWLLLAKGYPLRFWWRCAPMILMLQLSWLVRVLVRGKIMSYLAGTAGALALLPEMRRKRCRLTSAAADRLWREILRSEDMVRKERAARARGEGSTFLRWYFRLFR